MKIRDRIKELRRVRAKDLIPDSRNWRRHPEKQQKAMEVVLAEVGYADALLVREDDNGNLIIIDGHLRAGVTPDTKVPVLVLDVDEAEAGKILATLDPLAAMAEADEDAWSKLIDGLDADIPEFGDFLSDLAPLKNDASGGLSDEDAAPVAPESPVSRLGDLWVLGGHRLLCGDSTAKGDVERLLAGVEPGLMVTDPPYGVNYRPAWRGAALRDGAERREGNVSNDEKADWSDAWALFPGQVAYVWHASLLGGVVGDSIISNGFELRSQIVWAKPRFAISRGHYHWQHECCLYAVRKGTTASWQGDRSQTTLWRIDTNQNEEARNNHGTQKPVECMRRPILNHTNPGQSVYDPFVGSGTTIVAAQTIGRVCFALDVAPEYVDVAVKRWQDFTGEEAILQGDGQTFEKVEASRTQDPGTADDFQRGREHIAAKAEAVT